MSIMDNVQPAVKKETGKVAAITGIGLILMWIVFGVLHAFMPQKVPFDYTVFLGGAVGGCVAVLNFFFMGLAVQKAAAATDEDTARMRIKASYSQRMLIQMLWVILGITLSVIWQQTASPSCASAPRSRRRTPSRKRLSVSASTTSTPAGSAAC